MPELITYDLNFPVTVGQKPDPITFKLASQTVAIKGVLIDNAQGDVDLYVYPGLSAIGQPYVVKAGYLRGFSQNQAHAVTVVWSSVPGKNASIYFFVSSAPVQASDSAVVTITGTTSTQNKNDYPIGANPFNFGINGSVSSGSSTINIATFTGLQNQNIYMSFLRLQGLTAGGPLAWTLIVSGITIPGSNSPPYGLGDVSDVLLHPVLVGMITFASSVLKLAVSGPITGTVPIYGFIAGYTL